MGRHWAILTGEYPPPPGGVADHSARLAESLLAAGERVSVLAPAVGDCRHTSTAVNQGFRRLSVRFQPSGLASMERELVRCRPEVLLVQYVPHMYGLRGLNLPLALWLRTLRSRCRGTRVLVLFHEVAFPVGRELSLRFNVLGWSNRLMARLIADGADGVAVTVPIWADLLGELGVRRVIEWLPVPSNLPESVERDAVTRLRVNWGLLSEDRVVGHFGTFPPHVAGLLAELLISLLTDQPKRIGLLIGRGSAEFAERLRGRGRMRLRTVADLSAADTAVHLSAADVLVQPFADGISSRRTSLMAGLALGRPVVSNLGVASDPFWHAAEPAAALALAATPSIGELLPLVERWLAAPPESRQRLGGSAAEFYRRHFSRARLLERLNAWVAKLS